MLQILGKTFCGRTLVREGHTSRGRKCKIEIGTPSLTWCFLAFVGLGQNHSFDLNIPFFYQSVLQTQPQDICDNTFNIVEPVMSRLELHSVNLGSGAVTETLPASSAILHLLLITAMPELSYKWNNLERQQEQLCASRQLPANTEQHVAVLAEHQACWSVLSCSLPSTVW